MHYALHLSITLLLSLSLLGCSEPASTPPDPSSATAPSPAPASEAGDPATQPLTTAQGGTPEQTTEMEWDALIPEDFRPDKLMSELGVDDIADDDPRAAEFMEKLKALWDEAPVREELDGSSIRLPGFVVPVEGDQQETTGFLLVPYYGACVHVPPPPANQTVYVVAEAGKGASPGLFDVVWVTGTMSVKRIANDIAEAGYTLYASEIKPYD